jgi:hypothetical protein
VFHLIPQAIPFFQTGGDLGLFAQAVETLRSVGPFGLIILFVFGLYRRWWVMGNEFAALEKRAQKFEELALSSANIAERAATVAEVSVRQNDRKDTRRPSTRTRSTDES